MNVSPGAAADLHRRLPGPVGHRRGPGAGAVAAGGQPAAGRTRAGRRESRSSSGHRGASSRPAGRSPSTPRRPPPSTSSRPCSTGSTARPVGRVGGAAAGRIDGRVLLLARPAPDRRAPTWPWWPASATTANFSGNSSGARSTWPSRARSPADGRSTPCPSGEKRFVLVAAPPILVPDSSFGSLAGLGDWLVGQSVGGVQPRAADHPAVLADPSPSALLGPAAPGGARPPGRHRCRRTGDGLQHPPPVRLCAGPRREQNCRGASRLRPDSRRALVRLLPDRGHGACPGGRVRGPLRPMTTYVAMLRGINVSGRNRWPWTTCGPW